MLRFRASIRRKLLFATLTPLCVAILLSWFIGATLITDRVFRQAQQKVIGDLNSARKVYLDEIDHLTGFAKVAALNSEMAASLRFGRVAALEKITGQLLKSAMPEGGVLAVDAGLEGSGERVCVTVRDQGGGIREEDMGRLFTPFFSTKAQGTGLGLAVSYGIVSDHGGEIRVDSSPGNGASFTVLLPKAQNQGSPDAPHR